MTKLSSLLREPTPLPTDPRSVEFGGDVLPAADFEEPEVHERFSALDEDLLTAVHGVALMVHQHLNNGGSPAAAYSDAGKRLKVLVAQRKARGLSTGGIIPKIGIDRPARGESRKTYQPVSAGTNELIARYTKPVNDVPELDARQRQMKDA